MSDLGHAVTGTGTRPAERGLGPILIGAYTLSGVVSLGYEILWARMLSLQFGVSIFGVIATVAAFMGGLGAGSLLGTRWAARSRAPLRHFGLLEIAVAVFALLMPWLMAGTTGLVDTLASHLGISGWYLLYGTVAVVLLTLPAFAMGLGFALVVRAGRDLGLSLGGLYGWNTLGGALGALLPLGLLPAFGWLTATQATAGIGLIIGTAALWLSRRVPADADHAVSSAVYGPVRRVHWAYAGVGLASLMLQVGWTRLFGMVLLRTEYVLAILLAVFLAGIGLGSLAARHLRSPRWFPWIPVVAGLGAVASLWALPVLSAWAERAEFSSLAGALMSQGLALAALMLPVTFALGLWLPLLARQLGDDHTSGPLLYAFNSLGAAVGAVAAGVVLIPWLGTAATIAVAGGLLILFGLIWLPRPPLKAAMPLVVLLAWPVWTLPPVAELLPASQADSRDLYVHEDAVNITHVIARPGGQRVLLADLQRMDASSEPSAVRAQRNQGRLPLLLHPDPRSVLFLGLGTGISAAASLPFPHLQRTAVELSRGAVTAARQWFAPVNDEVTEELEVVRDDARRYLRSSDAHYDVIIGDLFHPDLAGRSALLSRQQFRRARQRLNPGGVFVQWLALNQFDPDSLAVVLRTFERVFPDGQVFMDGFRIALVGGRDGPVNAAALLHGDRGLSPAARGGESVWTWLGRYWGPVSAGPGVVQDEWAPRIEYSLPRARYRGDVDVAETLDFMLRRRPPRRQAQAQLGIGDADTEAFERGYAATELAARSWLASLRGDPAEGSRLLRLAYQANPDDAWVSMALAERLLETVPAARRQGLSEREVLERILGVDPDNPEVLRALWRQASAAGDRERAAHLRARLEQVDPLGDLTTRPSDSVGSDHL